MLRIFPNQIKILIMTLSHFIPGVTSAYEISFNNKDELKQSLYIMSMKISSISFSRYLPPS